VAEPDTPSGTRFVIALVVVLVVVGVALRVWIWLR
jgi:hypothetical protein